MKNADYTARKKGVEFLKRYVKFCVSLAVQRPIICDRGANKKESRVEPMTVDRKWQCPFLSGKCLALGRRPGAVWCVSLLFVFFTDSFS